jgi:hypothetical protein
MFKGEAFAMMKLRSKILAGASAVAVAGTLAVAGLTTASASPAARLSVSGIERFQLMTSSARSAKVSIIALGSVFTAGGIDHPGNKADTAVFPDGTFKIRHSAGMGTQHFNPKTCLAVIHQHGTYTLRRGTGAYAGISGHGVYHLSEVFIAARNAQGKCSRRLPPTAFQQLIAAQGPARL